MILINTKKNGITKFWDQILIILVKNRNQVIVFWVQIAIFFFFFFEVSMCNRKSYEWHLRSDLALANKGLGGPFSPMEEIMPSPWNIHTPLPYLGLEVQFILILKSREKYWPPLRYIKITLTSYLLWKPNNFLF